MKKNLYKLLNEIDKTTEINYYAAYGTLLGAVRNNGIIEWDTDCDILVSNENYIQFIEELKKNKNIAVYSLGDHDHLFCRVSVKEGNPLIESIDIFPLVGLPNNYVYKAIFTAVAKMNFKIYYAKKVSLKEYSERKKRGVQIVLVKLIFLLFPSFLFEKIYLYQLKKYKTSESEKVYNLCGSYGKREVFPYEWFDTIDKIDFGKNKIKVPKQYHKILNQIYGDYMTPKKDNYLS